MLERKNAISQDSEVKFFSSFITQLLYCHLEISTRKVNKCVEYLAVEYLCGGGAERSQTFEVRGVVCTKHWIVRASKATSSRRPLILPILNDVSLRHKNAGNVIWERPAYTTETKLLDFSKWKITNSPAYSLSDDMMAIIYTPTTVYAAPMNIYFHFYYQEIKIVAVHGVI